MYKNNDHGGLALAKIISGKNVTQSSIYSINPIIRIDDYGMPAGRIKDGDAVIFCCRRGEREIQLMEAFVDSDFNYFKRNNFKNLYFCSLTQYHEKFSHLPIAYPPMKITNTLPEIISIEKLKQLHIAESEKFAHVTYFLNGCKNETYFREEDIKIPSPRNVSFNKVPELSLNEVTNAVILGLKKGYDFIVTNFANGDVIGHLIDQDVKIKCANIIDTCLGKVTKVAIQHGYVAFITADHGNLEKMLNADGPPNTSHTTNPVPFIIVYPWGIDEQTHTKWHFSRYSTYYIICS